MVGTRRISPRLHVHECDSCGAEACGYTKAELAAEGWVFHHGFRFEFAMCDECEARYAELRKQAR